METPILDRPIPESSAPWPLSAPESYVLLHGPRAKGVEAFRRGLLELVARDVLIVETRERRGLFRFFTARTSFLLRGPKMPWIHSAAQPLRSIWDFYSRTCISVSPADPRGVRVRDLRRSARVLGTPLRDFTYWSVLPALMERGLYERDDYAAPRPSRNSRYTEATAGRAARIGDIAMAGRFELNTSSIDLDVLDLGWRGKLDGVFDAVGDTGSGGSGGGDWGWSDGDGGSGWSDGDGGGGWGDGGGGD